ncbi:hypothetical protein Tco_0796975 [Tanacetum coccineum]
MEDVSLVDGVFDGALGGDGDEDLVIGEGVRVSSSSWFKSTKSFLGEIIIMEYLVKISKKARLLELKRRHLKKTDSDIQYAISRGVNDPSRVEFQPKRARLV